MRRITVICTCALLALGVTGCDFFRFVAGRPTSSDLRLKQEQILAQEEADRAAERERAVRDSLEAVARHRADSAAAVEFFTAAKVSQIHSASLPGLRTLEIPSRYCIVLAGFSQPENADRFSARLQEAGYPSVVLKYPRGNNSLVGVCPTDDVVVLREGYEKVRQEKFCPKDAWILVRD